MRTGIPPQYMKQINGKIEIHIRDMVTPTYLPTSPPHQAVKLILSSGDHVDHLRGHPDHILFFFVWCVSVLYLT